MPSAVGRPRKSVDLLKEKVSITISPSILAKVDERADELELSRSTVIQMILREHFAE